MYRHLSSSITYIGYMVGLCIIYLLAVKKGILPAVLFAGIPFILLCALGMLQKFYSYYIFFVINYLIMGISRYYPLKSGVIMLALTGVLLITVLIKHIGEHPEWHRSKTYLTFIWGVWFLYCIFEFFNPLAMPEPWYISITNYSLYPLVCAVIIPVLFTKFKHFKWLLILWAFLTLFAAAKGYWQRNRGFDSAELNWLFNEGGASTHIIYTGIRYFSIYSDAANFGAGMGLASVILGISGFYIRQIWLKLLFWGTSIAGAYGLIISGTRSDVAIPFIGLAVFLVLSGKLKPILISSIILASAYIFLNHTTIGDHNRLIRRLRSTFNVEDASWQARVGNREKIYPLMQDKPFGVGLGLGGVKARRFKPHDHLVQIPTDSWFVMAWVETGIVGLILYVFVFISLLAHASYIAVFKIRNNELKGILLAIIGGISGIFVTCYANEVFNYPNGIIVYTLLAFLYTAKYYDEELQHATINP